MRVNQRRSDLEIIAEMLKVGGTDVFAIGLGDLANSMGYPGDANHPLVQETVAKMARQIRDAGKWAIVACRTTEPDEVRRYVNMGVQIIKYTDGGLLRQAAVAALKGARAAVC